MDEPHDGGTPDRETVEFDDGLVPVVAQDVDTGEVLMVAYANPTAVVETLESGYAHYYSRSRDELWRKGDTSGHVQRVHDVRIDCDGDTLLYRVDQQGGACHTGYYSCFHRSVRSIDGESTDGDRLPVDVEPVAEPVFEPATAYADE